MPAMVRRKDRVARFREWDHTDEKVLSVSFRKFDDFRFHLLAGLNAAPASDDHQLSFCRCRT